MAIYEMKFILGYIFKTKINLRNCYKKEHNRKIDNAN